MSLDFGKQKSNQSPGVPVHLEKTAELFSRRAVMIPQTFSIENASLTFATKRKLAK